MIKLTLKKDVNPTSLVLKHTILLEVSNLIEGREGALQTEKDLYLLLAFVDSICEENVIEQCNNDKRSMPEVIQNDIEPFFFDLIKDEQYNNLYQELKQLHLQRCKEIWDDQHSVIGLIDAILTTLSLMSDEDKKAALIETGKMAEEAYNRRTEVMEQKVDETNSKLEEFVRTYRENVNKKKDAE